MSDNVGALEDGAVVAFEVGFLQFYLIAVLAELLLNPLSAPFVSLAVHGTRTKIALGCAESISRIGIKLDAHNGLFCCLALLSGATGTEETGDEENEEMRK